MLHQKGTKVEQIRDVNVKMKTREQFKCDLGCGLGTHGRVTLNAPHLRLFVNVSEYHAQTALPNRNLSATEFCVKRI